MLLANTIRDIIFGNDELTAVVDSNNIFQDFNIDIADELSIKMEDKDFIILVSYDIKAQKIKRIEGYAYKNSSYRVYMCNIDPQTQNKIITKFKGELKDDRY